MMQYRIDYVVGVRQSHARFVGLVEEGEPVGRIPVIVIAVLCFSLSAASAGQEEQNINYLVRMPDAQLDRVAGISGRLYGVMKRCPALAPSEVGRAMMAVSLLLYHGRDRHLAPPGKFGRAIRVLESAYNKAALSKVACKVEKARDVRMYR